MLDKPCEHFCVMNIHVGRITRTCSGTCRWCPGSRPRPTCAEECAWSKRQNWLADCGSQHLRCSGGAWRRLSYKSWNRPRWTRQRPSTQPAQRVGVPTGTVAAAHRAPGRAAPQPRGAALGGPPRGGHLRASRGRGGGLGGAVGPGGPSGDDSCSFMFCSLILGGVDHLHYRLCCQGPSVATASHVSLCLERCQAREGKFKSPLWREAPQVCA
jgi:hypothetical protein